MSSNNVAVGDDFKIVYPKNGRFKIFRFVEKDDSLKRYVFYQIFPDETSPDKGNKIPQKFIFHSYEEWKIFEKTVKVQKINELEKRQLPLYSCSNCEGSGKCYVEPTLSISGNSLGYYESCTYCGGSGKISLSKFIKENDYEFNIERIKFNLEKVRKNKEAK